MCDSCPSSSRDLNICVSGSKNKIAKNKKTPCKVLINNRSKYGCSHKIYVRLIRRLTKFVVCGINGQIFRIVCETRRKSVIKTGTVRLLLCTIRVVTILRIVLTRKAVLIRRSCSDTTILSRITSIKREHS